MKSIKVFILLAILMAILSITLSSTPYEFEESFFAKEDNNVPMVAKSQEKASLRGISRFLGSQTVEPPIYPPVNRPVVTCDRNPKVCGASASCCDKKCVDLKTDKFNCGKCGVKVHHSQICCQGHLVNPMSDNKHCGSCDNRCKSGGSCAFGMCSYA